jgi:hypothetical protein
VPVGVANPMSSVSNTSSWGSLQRLCVQALIDRVLAVDGHLGLIGTKFAGTDAYGHSLTAGGLRATDAYLRHGFEAAGPVVFVGATIDSNFGDGRSKAALRADAWLAGSS